MAFKETMDDSSAFTDFTENRVLKRRRTNVQDDCFLPGNLMRVKVTNFTTYSTGTFNLSPTLNMIIGPNGAGKSTLVAAICLGLGGKLDLIKRKSMKSMIKTGEEEGSIEVTLKNFDPESPITIRRTFTETKTRWLVNNEQSDEKTVRRICKNFNIQMDNLCHFLPQERVVEFASLSPEKLLLELERTVNLGNLRLLHEDLISKDNYREDLKLDIARKESHMEDMVSQKAHLEKEVEMYEKYQEKVKEIRYHEMLIPYAQIQDLRERQKDIKKERDHAKKQLEQFKSNTRILEEQHSNNQKECEVLEADLESMKTKHTKTTLEYNTKNNDIARNRETISGLIITKSNLVNKSNTKKLELESIQMEKAELINKFSQLPEYDEMEFARKKEARDTLHYKESDLKSQLEDFYDQQNSISDRMRKVKQEILRHEEKLTTKDKLFVLEPRGRHRNELLENAYQAHIFLRRKPELRRFYLEAPVVSCDVKDGRYAKYVEKVIDNNTMLSLTISDQSAFNKISEALFPKYNAPLRLANEASSSGQISKEELESYGFECYLSDFISGPPDVINMLKAISKIHLIPVSRKGLTSEAFEKLLTPNSKGRIPFARFISADDFVTVSRSRYGSHQFFYTTEYVNEARFFGATGITYEARLRLEEQLSTLKIEFKQLREEAATHQTETEKIKDDHTSLLLNLSQVKNSVDRLKNIQKSKANLQMFINQKEDLVKKIEEESQRDYTEKIRVLERKVIEKHHLLSTQYKDLGSLLRRITKLSIDSNQIETSLLQVQNAVITIEKLKAQLADYHKILQEKYEEAKQRYDQIKKSDAAQKIREQNASYTEEQRKVLSNLASKYLANNTLSERHIRDRINHLDEERSLMETVDHSSLEVLRHKIAEIESLGNILPEMRTKKERLDERIENIRRQWEPELETLVNHISSSFRKNFTCVASDGRVDLSKSDRFKDWKLVILVKFRENADLKILNSQSQSGGERAVSTMFFIMSLQGLTDAPFRVVDEINQGMDPRNERIAHKHLIETACGSNSSQYFLVTPKLLTGLHYHPKMTIHCIYTGPLLDVSNMDLRHQR